MAKATPADVAAVHGRDLADAQAWDIPLRRDLGQVTPERIVVASQVQQAIDPHPAIAVAARAALAER